MPTAAYFNEIDPYAAQWLRNLIAAGHIAPGDVDERSIKDVQPDDLRPYTQCHFFAGIGVWSLALRRAGWPDELPVWTGSCPCQPYSKAGKGLGFADERDLWPDWFHLIQEREPSEVLGEQVGDAIATGPMPGHPNLPHLPALRQRHGAIMSLKLNIYTATFAARCPNDGAMIDYTLEIRTPETLMVERINEATHAIDVGHQEQIADHLHERFGGELRVWGTHQGVDIESVRLLE